MLLLALYMKRLLCHALKEFSYTFFSFWPSRCDGSNAIANRHPSAIYKQQKKHTKMHITTFRKIKSCGLILDFLLSTSWGLQYAYYLVWKFSDSVLCELSDAYKIFAMRWNRTNNIVTKAKSAKTLIQQREHAKEVVSGMHTKLCTMCTRPIH